MQDRLELKHSPEQIANRLREDFPDDSEMWVSHETIYQSIYIQGRGALKRELATCLRTGRAIRRPHRKADARQSRITDMVHISERPKEAADRAVPGHTDLSGYHPDYLAFVANQLNDRPRKRLDWRPPKKR